MLILLFILPLQEKELSETVKISTLNLMGLQKNLGVVKVIMSSLKIILYQEMKKLTMLSLLVKKKPLKKMKDYLACFKREYLPLPH
jgi:hypothetical protein